MLTYDCPARCAGQSMEKLTLDIKMIQKTISIITIIFALAVTIGTATIVIERWSIPVQRDLDDVVPPLLFPLLAAGIGLISAMLKTSTPIKDVFLGACIGCILYLIVPGLGLLFQYNLIRQDGTAFWGILTIPSIYLGIPCPIIGSILGLGIGAIIDSQKQKRESNKVIEST